MTRNLTRWLRFLLMFYLLFLAASIYFVVDGTLPWSRDLQAVFASEIATLLGVFILLKGRKLGFYIICLATICAIAYNYIYGTADFLTSSLSMLYVPVITGLFLKSNWHILK